MRGGLRKYTPIEQNGKLLKPSSCSSIGVNQCNRSGTTSLLRVEQGPDYILRIRIDPIISFFIQLHSLNAVNTTRCSGNMEQYGQLSGV